DTHGNQLPLADGSLTETDAHNRQDVLLEGVKSSHGQHAQHVAIPDKSASFPTTSLPLYRIAKTPNTKSISIKDVARRLGFPKFLKHLGEHPYFASLPINAGSILDVWRLIRITIPASTWCPEEEERPIFAHSGLEDSHPRRWDVAFYVPTDSPIQVRKPETEGIHSYSVGRIALVFALKPTFQVPKPRLMAYVQRFSEIPKTAAGLTGLYAVARLQDRQAQPRFEVIAASQIARPCPLSPLIKGPATTKLDFGEYAPARCTRLLHVIVLNLGSFLHQVGFTFESAAPVQCVLGCLSENFDSGFGNPTNGLKIVKKMILAQIGSFCLVSVGLFVLLEIVILYPRFHYSYRCGLDNVLVLLTCGIPVAIPLSCPLPLLSVLSSSRSSLQASVSFSKSDHALPPIPRDSKDYAPHGAADMRCKKSLVRPDREKIELGHR
ncbi:plasma membrane H+-ATPase, partial [Ceratobasidium sp. 395]